MPNRLTPAQRIFRQICRSDAILEDRREYDAEMLATMYGLDTANAAELYALVRAEFGNVDSVAPEVVSEYFREATHGGWDGWTKAERHVINRLMADIVTYDKAR